MVHTRPMTVPRFDPIGTERLLIRPMVRDDVDALHRRRDDPAPAEFQNWTLPYPRERAQQLVDEMVAFDGVPPADGWFQVAVDDLDGSPLGDVAIGFSFDGRIAEIGYTVDSSANGRGIATEAAGAIVTWLFDVVGVSRVSAMMHPENLASVRVAENVGMVFEGHTRNSYWVGDVNSDDWIFGVTPESRRAWTGRPTSAPSEVDLVEVTTENLADVERLATHRSQERLVATVAQSFADALVPGGGDGESLEPWYRAIVADGVVTGFVTGRDPTSDRPDAHLTRLLVDRLHQRRGIGGRALDLVVDRARSRGAPAIDVSWVPGPGSPAPLYLGRGFEPTGEVRNGETYGRLGLDA